jgi:poly-beta-1,6-N-acetyl-D-glucosamine synthase
VIRSTMRTNPGLTTRPTVERQYLNYVLITPARNERQFIELTLRSVVKQSLLPSKWVIVSDGSTDGTDELVNRYTAEHPWIELIRMPERASRDFAGKVHAFNAGYARVADVPYQVIGNLDADISFEKEYLAYLLAKFAENPRLGVAGTPYQEAGKTTYDYRFASTEFVSGACQLFRRECFEQIGGYQPFRGGTVDSIAVITARMMGWETRTFTNKTCAHHRPSGTAEKSTLAARFRWGAKDYALGNHPVWEFFRTAFQMTKKPFVIGGLALLSGYAWCLLRHKERAASPELVAFRQREQMQRLRQLLTAGWNLIQKAS